MAPDVEELINRVNTLTLDKNRLKQKLTQLTNDQNGKDAFNRLNQLSLLTHQSSAEESTEFEDQPPKSGQRVGGSEQSPANISDSSIASGRTGPSPPKNKPSSSLIAGVDCATSSEDDLLYINQILRSRVDEYNDKWDYLQSKCSALLSELSALQMHYACLKNEKTDLEERFKKKCDECDDIKSELQTVVLNYETQLSAMSEHLSAIASRPLE